MRNSLDEYRSDFDISQQELADYVEVTRQTINAIERDRYDPSVELVFKLAAFFECSVGDIFQPDVGLEKTISEVEEII